MSDRPAAQAESADARQDRRIAAWLGLWFVLLYAAFYPGHFQGTDEVSVYETTRSLYELGTLAVAPHQGAYRGTDGRQYSIFAVGQSALALPFYAAGAVLRNVLPTSWQRTAAGPPMRVQTTTWGGTFEIFATGLYAPVASGTLLALFFLFERRLGASRRSALTATFLLGTTTYVAMMSIYFLQHTSEAIAIVGALFALQRWNETGSLRALACGSGLASAVLLIRVPATVSGPGLAGYLLYTLWQRRQQTVWSLPRAATAIAAPAAAVFALHAAVNHAKWGTWLLSPMLSQYTRMNNPIGVGLQGFLLAPGESVFAYTPLLLLAPLLLRDFARRHAPECVCVVAICLCFLLFCSRYDLWTGLYSCPGPRYQFLWTPLVLLALGPWLDAHRGVPARAALWVLAALGLGVQLVLLLASWPAVIAKGRYLEYQPPKGFLYVLRDTPIAQSAVRVADGDLGSWLWSLARGFEGQAPHPALALALATGLAVALAACTRGLARALRKHATA